MAWLCQAIPLLFLEEILNTPSLHRFFQVLDVCGLVIHLNDHGITMKRACGNRIVRARPREQPASEAD
jgi:hypothetical protein